jgi:hypothetical protein
MCWGKIAAAAQEQAGKAEKQSRQSRIKLATPLKRKEPAEQQQEDNQTTHATREKQKQIQTKYQNNEY